jgi:hypothetical protein
MMIQTPGPLVSIDLASKVINDEIAWRSDWASPGLRAK